MDSENIMSERPISGLEKYIPDFINSRENELSKINSLVESSDYETIQKMAHDWKGFAEPYGFGRLAQMAISLEDSAKLRNPQKCYSSISEIKTYIKDKKLSFKDLGFL